MIFSSLLDMKPIIYTISLILFVLVFSACNKKRTVEGCTEKVTTDCVCPTVVDPVCGCNSVTYGNACEAECHGITDYTPGICK